MSETAPPPDVAFARADGLRAGWSVSPGLTGYREAEAAMVARAEAIAAGEAGELVWLLQHPPLYTAGISAKPADLLAPGALPVFESGRGGQFTYHGPGQRVVYLMLDLRARRRDVRAFVAALEAWLIAALDALGVAAGVRPGRVGVWVEDASAPLGEAKIAAIGVRLRRWVSLHGVSLNVAPDLTHFAGIVPCGLAQHGVTSLAALGAAADMASADIALRASFERVFGPVADAAAPLPA
jgi:lipoyl(octanoyl) transferase